LGAGQLVEINKRLEPDEATKVISDIVRHGGEIVLSRHCRNRMNERNLSMHDLLAVLLNGVVEGSSEYSKEHEQYRYKVTGQTIDSGKATAVTVILNHRSILIVTVY